LGAFPDGSLVCAVPGEDGLFEVGVVIEVRGCLQDRPDVTFCVEERVALRTALTRWFGAPVGNA
jgi:hypothetical protein